MIISELEVKLADIKATHGDVVVAIENNMGAALSKLNLQVVLSKELEEGVYIDSNIVKGDLVKVLVIDWEW